MKVLNFKNQSQLKKNIFSGSFTATVNILLSLISYPLYLHFVGADLYGLWATLSIVTSFSAIGSLGIDEAIIKYVAEEHARKNRANILNYVSTGVNFLIISGIIIFVIFIAVEEIISNFLNFKGEYINIFHELFPFIILLSVFTFIVTLINAVLRGLGRFDQANYFFQAGRFIAVAVSLLFFLNGYKLWGLYWGQILSFVFVLAISSISIFKKIGYFYNPFKFKKESLVTLVKFGGTLTVTRIISMLTVPFIKLIITRYIGLIEVAYFEIANKVVWQIRNIFDRGINAIMPEISGLSVAKENPQKRIDQLMKKVYKLILFVGIPVFTLLFFIGNPLLNLWLAKEYNFMIGLAFKIIIIGVVCNLLVIPIWYYFIGTGKVQYCFLSNFTAAVLNFMLILILIFFNIVDFKFLMIVYSFAAIIGALTLIIIFFKKSKRMKIKISRAQIVTILKEKL